MEPKFVIYRGQVMSYELYKKERDAQWEWRVFWLFILFLF